MKTFLRLHFYFVFMIVGLYGQGSTITADGFGMTENAAIEQAKRAAVEIGVGSVMSSETVVKNSVMRNQVVSSKHLLSKIKFRVQMAYGL